MRHFRGAFTAERWRKRGGVCRGCLHHHRRRHQRRRSSRLAVVHVEGCLFGGDRPVGHRPSVHHYWRNRPYLLHTKGNRFGAKSRQVRHSARRRHSFDDE